MSPETRRLWSARWTIFFAVYRSARKQRRTRISALREAWMTKDRRKKLGYL